MKDARQLLLQLFVVVATGTVVCVCFNFIFIPIGAHHEVTIVINVTIFSCVFLMSCILATIHFLRLKTPDVETIDSMSIPQRFESRKECKQDTVCSICLCSLTDWNDIHRMDCCKNDLHRSCLHRYVCNYVASNGYRPVCILCRKEPRSLSSV